MTAPPLTALDTYGRVLLRAMLREEPSAATIADLRGILEREGATFTVEEIAAEVGAKLPVEPTPLTPARRASRPARKDRHRWV